jgi:hypothetical protein
LNNDKGLNTALIIMGILVAGIGIAIGIRAIVRKKRNPLSGGTDVDEFWYKTIYGVIAHEGGRSEIGGRGKDFTDIHDNDNKGGTVGICHFASGGLCALYKNMDTQKYFGKSSSEMCDNWANRNSGAYDQSWWRTGMEEFLNNPDNNMIQVNTCKESRMDSVKEAQANGWTTDRQFAIAAGMSNSLGNGGFKTKANEMNWDAEALLSWYGQQSDHKGRREFQVNKWFPKNKARKIDL